MKSQATFTSHTWQIFSSVGHVSILVAASQLDHGAAELAVYNTY
jgi:uncharacterized membrane protein